MDLFAEFLRVFGGFADAIRGVMGGWIYPEKLSKSFSAFSNRCFRST